MNNNVSLEDKLEIVSTTPMSNGLLKLPRLYKKNNTGTLQFWDIYVQEKELEVDPTGGEVESHLVTKIKVNGAEIVTTFGQLGTDKPQTTKDPITEGKNAGKKNETSAVQQAVKEMQSKWEKQKKKGYVESKEDALAGAVDELVEGGLFPMLAQSFEKHAAKIVWPVYVQPKLDGIRCIAIVQNGKATLWTRTRKQINSLPHIIAELEANFTNITLDGELYNHSLKKDFEQIVSLVRLDEPEPNGAYTKVQYHVYDIVNDDPFSERTGKVTVELSSVDLNIIVPVETLTAVDEGMLMMIHTQFKNIGYEGSMLRNADSKYEQNKRSYGLQKVKDFDDAEFDIIGIEEGRGKLSGMVANFVLKTNDGKEFSAKMSGSMEMLKQYYADHSLWTNKKLTVQYQGLTGTNGVPRFPVGIAIRNYE